MSLTSRAAALASGDKALLRPRPGLASPTSHVSTGAAGGIRLPLGAILGSLFRGGGAGRGGTCVVPKGLTDQT